MRRRNPLYAAIIIAVILLVITILAVLIAGYRYTTDDGIKFVGKSEGGQPISGTINYPDGSSATLDYLNSTILYDNGDVYVGGISGVNRNGNGKMTFAATGDVYEGLFVDDKMTGNGKMTYANGDVYEGSMVDSKKHGYGKFTFANGNSYEGTYEQDVMSGYGIFIWSSGARYEGYFADDVKDGQGKMTFANGDVYEGQFARDMRNGSGLYTWGSNDTTYSGTFRNNLMDTRLVDENGNFIVNADGTYEHGAVGYYTTVSEEGKKTYKGYFEEGKIVAVYENQADTSAS